MSQSKVFFLFPSNIRIMCFQYTDTDCENNPETIKNSIDTIDVFLPILKQRTSKWLIDRNNAFREVKVSQKSCFDPVSFRNRLLGNFVSLRLSRPILKPTNYEGQIAPRPSQPSRPESIKRQKNQGPFEPQRSKNECRFKLWRSIPAR